MKTLQELKNELLADGVIDANEAKELETLLFADGRIDSEEANFIFELNDAVSGKSNDVAWNKLFVKAITSYLLDDEDSPGEIDETEADWLYNKIKGDGQIDGLEKRIAFASEISSEEFPSKIRRIAIRFNCIGYFSYEETC